jgi:hypothetical protein
MMLPNFSQEKVTLANCLIELFKLQWGQGRNMKIHINFNSLQFLILAFEVQPTLHAYQFSFLLGGGIPMRNCESALTRLECPVSPFLS